MENPRVRTLANGGVLRDRSNSTPAEPTYRHCEMVAGSRPQGSLPYIPASVSETGRAEAISKLSSGGAVWGWIDGHLDSTVVCAEPNPQGRLALATEITEAYSIKGVESRGKPQRASLLVTKEGVAIATSKVVFVPKSGIACVGLARSKAAGGGRSTLTFGVMVTWHTPHAGAHVQSWKGARASTARKLLCYILRFDNGDQAVNLMRRLCSSGDAPAQKRSGTVAAPKALDTDTLPDAALDSSHEVAHSLTPRSVPGVEQHLIREVRRQRRSSLEAPF